MPYALFQRATKALREQAVREFAATDFGKVIDAFERGRKQGAKGVEGFTQAVKRAWNTPLFQTLRDVQKYAKQSGQAKEQLGEFFEALGPAGNVLRALIVPAAKPGPRTANVDGMIEGAINLLRAFGFEVLDKRATAEELNRQAAAAREYLEGLGYRVIPPGAAEEPARRDTFPFGISPQTKEGKSRKELKLPIQGPQTKFPANHPIVTGQMVTGFTSSNVWGFSYDVENWYLYVRFKAGKGDKRSGPGPMYRYSNVPPRVFLAMLNAPSKGTFIWDDIRVRGTVSGHQYDYSLVGTVAGYVPRKATLTAAGEEFIPREVAMWDRLGGMQKSLKSALPRQMVRPRSMLPRGTFSDKYKRKRGMGV